MMPREGSQKMNLKVHTGLVVLGFSLLGLSGCSTISSGVDSVGEGIIYVAEGIEKVPSDVKVWKVSEARYDLSLEFYEPVKSLDSWAMRIEAREVCPDGYIYLSRNARKSSGFAYSEAQCEGEMSCAYQLEWRIKCEDVPDEPFSLFGKT